MTDSQTDNISGEQVVHTYDALNRLATAGATNSSWGQSYGYDGFGNLQNQTVTAGTAPSLSVVYNAATNRQTTDCADANGNIMGSSCVYPLYSYDVSNRIAAAQGGVQYSYAPGNKRVWKGILQYSTPTPNTLTTDVITFWSVTGQKLGDYNLTGDPTIVYTTSYTLKLTFALATANYYFGGKQIGKFNGSTVTYAGSDRLGSFGKYYPWGQEKPSATGNNTEKFTGYYRDSETGLDYADQRYHQPGMGRFLTMDQANASPVEPATWNRYGYSGGDPVNNLDPHGMYYSPEACQQNPASCQGPPSGSVASGCSSAGSGFFDYYDPNCQAQNCPASFAEEFFGNPGNGASADCQPGIPGAYILAPPPPCPLVGIFGDFTTHQGGSSTPIHTIFSPTVAGILDIVIAELNNEGIIPIIEDGFRTTAEQQDRINRFPQAAKLSWHEVGDAIDFSRRDPNLAAINKLMLAAGFQPVAGDIGHYQMPIGVNSKSRADECTAEHPDGN